MEETIFFNRGNALASKKDAKELIKEIQVEKDRRKPGNEMVIVQDEETGELILFQLSDQETPSITTQEYRVKEIIDWNKEE